MINFKSKVVNGKRIYRIFYRLGFNRLSRLSEERPVKTVRKVFRAPGRLAYDIRAKLMSQK